MSGENLEIKALLVMAKQASDVASTQDLYESALKKAERHYGQDSPKVGEILLELHTIYENTGQDKLAESSWLRISKILMSHS